MKESFSKNPFAHPLKLLFCVKKPIEHWMRKKTSLESISSCCIQCANNGDLRPFSSDLLNRVPFFWFKTYLPYTTFPLLPTDDKFLLFVLLLFSLSVWLWMFWNGNFEIGKQNHLHNWNFLLGKNIWDEKLLPLIEPFWNIIQYMSGQCPFITIWFFSKFQKISLQSQIL